MQIKTFTIPIMGGELMEERLNKFLRGHRILSVENHLLQFEKEAFWTYAIKYLEAGPQQAYKKVKIDYKEVLGADEFARFSKLRGIRKTLAQAEAVPAYAIFTNEELAKIAALDKLSLSGLKAIKGIGERKLEKYGDTFVNKMRDEKG